MSQKRKDKRRARFIRGMIALIVILLILLIVFMRCRKTTGVQKENGQEKEVETIELPYKTDDGKLEILSLFQASIANPDCNDELGENIASIEVKNESGQFLSSAHITIMLEDDVELQFEITDVPAGGTIWAFDVSNKEISEQPICKMVECNAEYEETASMMEEELSIEADGTSVIIRNLTDQNLTNIDVGFHCLFDEDVYYGGKVYTYPIDEIQAGASVSLEVTECYLGKAQVVRVSHETQKEE